MEPFPAADKTCTQRCLGLPVSCFMKGPILSRAPSTGLKNRLAESVISKIEGHLTERERDLVMGQGPLVGRLPKALVLCGCSSSDLGIHNSDEFSLNAIMHSHDGKRKSSFPWEPGTQSQMFQTSQATESRGGQPAWIGLCLSVRSFNLEMRHLQEGCILRRFLNMERKRSGFQDCWGAFLPVLSGLQETFP